MKRSESTPSPTWSLVTVTFNSAKRLRGFWSDYRPSHDVEWIVADNGSDDDSVEVAHGLGAHVIKLERNIGFGGANNVAFRQCAGKYVAFVNPDVTPMISDLPILEGLLDQERNALVAPQLLNSDSTLQPNGRGLPYLAHKVRNRTSPAQGVGTYLHYAEPGELKRVAWLTGAVIAGTRERLSALGPWDERFFVYYEDSDLGLRNEAAGGKNLVVGDIRWLHGWARETASLSLRAWRREVPSMIKFYARYPHLLSLRPHEQTTTGR